MKKNFCILLFIIICVPSCSNMKSKMLPLPVAGPSTTAITPPLNITSGYTFIGGTKGEVAYDIQQTSDGGYIIAGRAEADIPSLQGKTPLNAFSGAYNEMLVVKLDPTGNTEWYTFIGKGSQAYAYSIQQTADGGYIVAGASFNIPSLQGKTPLNPYYTYGALDMLVVKLDSTGNTEWYTFLGGVGDNYARSIQQTADGGYIVAGYTTGNIATLQGKTPLNAFTVSSGNNDMLVVKLDSTGNTAWYTFLGGSGDEFARSIQETSDGGYIVAGDATADIPSLQGKTPLNPFSAGADMLVVKLDSTGNTAWHTFLGGPGSDYAYSIRQASDGGYIVAGYADQNIASLQGMTPLNPYSSGYDMLVVKLDSTGNTAWHTFLGGSGNEYAQCIRQTSDGGYIIAGYTSGNIPSLQGKTPLNPHAGGIDMLAVRLDSSGTTSWYLFLGSSASFGEWAHSIQQTRDGGYVIAGCGYASIASLQGKAPLNPYTASCDMLIFKFYARQFEVTF